MQIPAKQTTRIAADVWIAAEAMARHRGMPTMRDALEYAVREKADRLAEMDPQFRELWDRVKNEN
jgi:hypothetical protein